MADPAYKLVPADRDFLRWLLDPLAPMENFFLTYRLPWMKLARITYPPSIHNPEIRPEIEHEKHHVAQFAPWWAPWLLPWLIVLLPLPFLFSGRWFVERGAYLDDIRAGRHSVESAVAALWESYGWAWPKPWMRAWFTEHLLEVLPRT